LEAWHQLLHYLKGNSSSRLRINKDPDLPKSSPYTLKPGHPTPGQFSLLRHPFTTLQSTGILTCLPSTTHLCLALGADSPCADYRGAGNLGFTACGFFTRIIVTHVSIRTSDISSTLLNAPSQTYRTLLYHLYSEEYKSEASVDGFSPVTSSAQADSTSELLRFL
jgi:hypothetical protein